MVDPKKKKKVPHRKVLPHKLAKYIRANPIHITYGPNLPRTAHLILGGKFNNKTASARTKWYPADDQKEIHKKQVPKPLTKLRNCITPGTILILLTGRFRGKRVVFLKQLQSGLLLVTGPYKINGIPLKRVNQCYVIATSTKVNLQGVNFDQITDNFFNRIRAPKRVKKSEKNFFTVNKNVGLCDQLTENQLKEDEEKKKYKKDMQLKLDQKLIENIKNVEMLKNYMSARFSLRNNQILHRMRF